jgi:hypothetical protein
VVRSNEESAGKQCTRPIIEELSAREGFMELVQLFFRLDINDRFMLVQQFDFIERVIACLPVKRLIIPNDFSALPVVREAVLADLHR